MFGKILAKLRKKRNLSQYDLADIMGLSRGQIANYEQGTRQPDFDILKKFADYFEVSTDYLLGRTDTPEPTAQDNDEAEFQAFINDPELQVWYKELPKSDEEELRKLRTIWEMIKNEKKTK